MKNKIQKFLVYFVICYTSLLIGGGWRTGVPLNTPRQGAASVVMGNHIYVMGGKSLNNTILNTVEIFDLSTGTWKDTIASFNTPRMGAAAIVFNNKIFLTGGRDDSSDVIDEVEVYDPAQNLWQSAQDMRRKREGHTLAFFNNRIHAIGGQKDEYSLEEEIEWYDTTTGWKEANFEIISPRVAFFSSVIRDTFYMCGGFYYGPLKDSYIKPPLGTTWIPGSNMATFRGGGASALLGDNLFMIGGETLSGITNSVEIYDINNWQIIPGPNLPTPRKGMTAVRLNDSIYVIGGVTTQSGPPTTLVEIYDEVTGIGDFDDLDQIIKSAHLVGYPNPFNGRINLKFQIPTSSVTQLTIVDIQGRHIRTLVNENLIEGTHLISWDGKDLQNRQVASGVYFAILKGNRFSKTFKMIYVK